MGNTKKQRAARGWLEAAVTWKGSRAALAGEMRVSEQTIREWISTGRVPRTPARLLALLMAPTIKGMDPLVLERALVA